MSYIKTVPALTRAGVDINVRRLNTLSNRRAQSTVASTQADQDVTNRESYSSRKSRNASSSPKISIDFELTQEAYKSKNNLELLRSLVVFTLCSYDLLIDKEVW